MKLFARGNETLAQVLGKKWRVPSCSLEALELAHSIGIDSRLVFEIERDCTEDLRESQSFEFSQDRFRRETFVEALNDGVQRYAGTGHIVPPVTLFNVFFGHRINYSGMPRPLAPPNKAAHAS